MLQLETVGYADLAKREAMRENHLFWIASMTKPLVGVCILMLQEEGKLSVEDAVEKHLPEFKGKWMVSERAKASSFGKAFAPDHDSRHADAHLRPAECVFAKERQHPRRVGDVVFEGAAEL